MQQATVRASTAVAKLSPGLCFGPIPPPRSSPVDIAEQLQRLANPALVTEAPVLPMPRQQFNFRPIIAVRILCPDGSVEDVYALLDSGSNRSIISKYFIDRHKLPTIKSQVVFNSLCSLSVEERDVGRISIESLSDPRFQVKDIDVIVMGSIPAGPKDIPCQNDLLPHPHLSQVKLKRLMRYQNVDLLIGTDALHAFTPTHIWKSPNSSIVGCDSKFGHYVFGPAVRLPTK